MGKMLKKYGGVSGWMFFHTFGKRWTAGPLVDDVVKKVKQLDTHGKGALVNLLGEHYTKKYKVEQTKEEYSKLIDALAELDVHHRLAVSLKPTQFGLYLPRDNAESIAYSNMIDTAIHALVHGLSVWFDMEKSDTTDMTIDTYLRISRTAKQYLPNRIGIALQANLKRTEKDLLNIMKNAPYGSVRLVKGIYKEPDNIAYTDAREIHGNFSHLIHTAFRYAPDTFSIVVGTHHTKRIEETINLGNRYPKKFGGIQMLMGVSKRLEKKLIDQNIPLDIYTPYGPESFMYTIRRMKENPSFIFGVLRMMFFEKAYLRRERS